jgi:hypothetical protein
MDSKNYKKIPLHKTKSLKKLIPESKNILDDNIIINDNNSPVNNKPQSLSELLRNKDIRFLSLLYTFFCFSVMFVDEVFPLWAVRCVYIYIYIHIYIYIYKSIYMNIFIYICMYIYIYMNINVFLYIYNMICI